MPLRIPISKPAHSPRSLRAQAGHLSLESLEPRALLFAWTAQEVYFSELIDRARADPFAEAAALGMDFTDGLTTAEQALLVPHQPLALSAALTTSARLHSADMAARNFFDHVNPDGLSPTARAQAAGYAGTAGENIGAGYASIDDLYQVWMNSADERRNALSLITSFNSSYHYDQIGPGFDLTATGAAYSSYFTADFGNPSAQTRTPWLLGVVFTDADHDNFYSIGEGAANIRVDVFTGSSTTGTPTATYTTDAAGNYQLPLADGSYTVVFTRTADNFRVVKSAVVSGQNVELSAQTSELLVPDDHPNAGQWSGAAPISIESTTGSGSISGALAASGDTDLFTFTASKSGVTHISGLPVSAAFGSVIRIYNAAHSLIATGTLGANSADSAADVSLSAGSTYFILVSAGNNTATGAYSITIEGPSVSGPVIPPQKLGADGEPVNPLWLGSRPVLGFVNQLGRPVIAIRVPSGQWNSIDIQQASGSPDITGDLKTWVDSRDGLLYAAAASPSGVLVYKRSATGVWTYRNLTTEIAVSHNIISNLTTFTDAGGLRQIAGLDASGHMVTYWMTGIMWPQGWRYFFTDVAARDLTRRNHPASLITSPVTSYVTQKNSLNILGANAAGEVILYFRPGGGLATQIWNWTNLSTLTGCAPLVGDITAAETTGRIVNISGTDASGNLWMITWRSGEGWRSTNATAAASHASTLVPGSVASWINSGGASFVAGLTSGGDIVLYRYVFSAGQNNWSFAAISAAIPSSPLITGTLRAAITSAGAILISGVTAEGEIVRFTFDTNWSAESISEIL